MSPRAAVRLDQLGFGEVYDYAAGKADWLAAGLPREGESASVPFAGDVADRDVPTCRHREPVGEVLARLEAEGHELCVVVDPDRVVLGLLHRDAPVLAPELAVETAMESGPTTVRASAELGPLAHRMLHSGLEAVPVTTPEGRLLGLLRREAADDALRQDAELVE
jgi:CBS domain-containing protein